MAETQTAPAEAGSGVATGGETAEKKEDRYDEGTKGGNLPGVEEDLLKPLYIAEKIVERPFGFCLGCIVFMFILAALDGLVFAFSEESDRTWFVESSEEATDYDTWVLAGEALSGAGGEAVTPQTQEASGWTIQWMFELDDYDGKVSDETDWWILTPSQLETIIEWEEKNTADPDWTNQFCYVENTDTWECVYTSLARDVAQYFDYDYDSMTTEEIRDYVWYLYTTSDSPGTIESMFNPEFATDNQTFVYRSFLSAAMPITTDRTPADGANGTETRRSSYKNDADKPEKQEDIYAEYADEFWQDVTVKHSGGRKDNGLRILFFEFTVFNDQFNVLLNESLGWVLAAMVAVVIWITVHLQSAFLSVLALTQIILSFPAAYFIYALIFQIDHFDTLSTLIIFVLLGVGADDVFVFTDAWRQSIIFVDDPTDLKQRMSFSYRRAAKAMLVTQATTFFAFLATATSQIMPISAFGIWAALIVMCNYLLVITLYPAILIVHFKYVLPFETLYCCCCCHKEEPKKKKKKDEKDVTEAKNGTTTELTAQKKDAGSENNDEDDDDDDDDRPVPPAIARRQSTVEELAGEYGCLESFFAQTWSQWVQKGKYPILICFAVLFSIAVWQASQLEQQNEQEQWFSDDHYMQQTLDFFGEFSSSEETDLIYVTILFGAKGVNRDGSDPWDPLDYGKIRWDSSFDLSTEEAQSYFYDACQDLKETELVFQSTSVLCPIENFKDYLEDMDETFPYVASDDATVQKEMFAEKMYNFSQSQYGVFINVMKLLYVEDAEDRSDDTYYVRYIAIGIYTAIETDADLTEQRDAQEDMNDWVKDNFEKNAPEGIDNPIASSFNWSWMRTNNEFIVSAFQGIGIALPLAFVVLMISTQNWIMSIFATFDIIGVMTCELGVMHVAGWKFGVSESVAIVIIIGFSVDYVVHLANAYLESSAAIRSERLSFALLTMGISVVSGALTTFLGGIFLTFPDLTFFIKMGILIMTTIFFSLLWSMLFFIALLAAFGPEYEKGKMPWCEKATEWISENVFTCKRRK